jgi:uncharacterized protein (TIGR03437 family)
MVVALATFMSFFAHAQVTGASTAPAYSSQSIVNAATQTVEALAPNTIATLYGTNLSFTTQAVASSDVAGGTMPLILGSVAVWVNDIPCPLFLVSPTQINFLVPYDLTAGTVSVMVVRQSQEGPSVPIQLNNTSPGLFLWNVNYAVAEHLNGSVISAASPAASGEIIIVYAAGLGLTSPGTVTGQLVTAAASILYKSQLQVLLDGVAIPASGILYAGLTPGFAGLYQINLQLPTGLSPNPEIQLAIGAQISPASIQLALQ